MTRVLQVIYGFGYGGIRAFIMNYLTHLDKDKYSVDIYAFGCDSSPFTQQVEDLGAHIYFEPENQVRDIKKFVGQLKRFMEEHGPYDVVHAHNNLISAWVLLAAKLAHVPIRLSHSHTASHFYGSLPQRMYSYLRRGIIDCLATKKLACGQLAGETMYGKKSHFEIVANGINLDRFLTVDNERIAAMRRNLQIPEGVRVYANVTRMDPPKNHLFAIEVFREIHKLDPQAIFVYGGVTPPMMSTCDAVKKKVSEYQLEDNCRYMGPIMDIETLYHLSDLWIYCSAYEGLPFGPIELQAASTPVLCSDVITEEVDLGLGLVHFLSLNDDPKKWAKLAVTIPKNQVSKEVIIEAFQRNNFDIRQGVHRLEAIYEGN